MRGQVGGEKEIKQVTETAKRGAVRREGGDVDPINRQISAFPSMGLELQFTLPPLDLACG
jgi:hypothetical protein